MYFIQLFVVVVAIAKGLGFTTGIFTSLLLAANKRGCPRPSALPSLFNKNTFFCARMWDLHHHLSFLSCYGEHYDVYNDQHVANVGSLWNDRISAVVVRPGCEMHFWEDSGYSGSYTKLTGMAYNLKDRKHGTVSKGSWRSNTDWSNEMTSFRCTCQFSNKPLRCIPRDYYRTLTECHNTGSQNMRCVHSIQRGTTIGTSVTRGKSVSTAVEASIGGTFKKVFTVGLSVSRTTTYDWSKTSSKTFSSVVTRTVWCTVAPGETIKMVRLVGQCGDTMVYPGTYKCLKQ